MSSAFLFDLKYDTWFRPHLSLGVELAGADGNTINYLMR